MIAIGGDLDNPLAVTHSGGIGDNVHFFMPSNERDQPELEDDDEQSTAAITIEGKAEDDEAA